MYSGCLSWQFFTVEVKLEVEKSLLLRLMRNAWGLKLLTKSFSYFFLHFPKHVLFMFLLST